MLAALQIRLGRSLALPAKGELTAQEALQCCVNQSSGLLTNSRQPSSVV